MNGGWPTRSSTPSSATESTTAALSTCKHACSPHTSPARSLSTHLLPLDSHGQTPISHRLRHRRPSTSAPGLQDHGMEEFGERMQYSVFVCDLSRSELIHARARVEAEMELAEDSVLIIELGEPAITTMTFVGQRRTLPGSGSRIV